MRLFWFPLQSEVEQRGWNLHAAVQDARTGLWLSMILWLWPSQVRTVRAEMHADLLRVLLEVRVKPPRHAWTPRLLLFILPLSIVVHVYKRRRRDPWGIEIVFAQESWDAAVGMLLLDAPPKATAQGDDSLTIQDGPWHRGLDAQPRLGTYIDLHQKSITKLNQIKISVFLGSWVINFGIGFWTLDYTKLKTTTAKTTTSISNMRHRSCPAHMGPSP